MARLDKLLIQGIRSFGPEEKDQQTIKFYSPLSLILGQNGCGKTTIIESLKYALTGDLPPGAKQGRLFLHDPKISRKVETHGRIMLQFMDLKGSKLVVTRLMQLTQKAKNLEFKSRDSSLRKVTRTGERADISGRCLDIDMEVSASLGVSKSILNNVLFCHQEDSAWPLDEGKKVKEKFDDIFDATKHNKYLEHIRLKKKAIADDLKLVNNDIEHLQKINDEVNSKKEELNEAINRMNVNKDQIEKYNNKLKPISTKLEMLRKREGHIQNLITEKEKKKTELQGIQKNQHELEESIETRFQGTIEELNKVIENFNSEMKVKQVERNNLNSKLYQLDKEDKKLQTKITGEEVKKGKLQTEVDQHYERIGHRNKKVYRLAENFEIHERIYFLILQ